MKTAERKRPIPKVDPIEAVQQRRESNLSPSGSFGETEETCESSTWTDAALTWMTSRRVGNQTMRPHAVT